MSSSSLTTTNSDTNTSASSVKDTLPTFNDDPRIFKRFPYELREHWLTEWNPKNDVDMTSCIDALDIWMYCHSTLTCSC